MNLEGLKSIEYLSHIWDHKVNSQSKEKEKETNSEPDLLENQHSVAPASAEDTGCVRVSPVIVQILVI